MDAIELDEAAVEAELDDAGLLDSGSDMDEEDAPNGGMGPVGDRGDDAGGQPDDCANPHPDEVGGGPSGSR
jgi:hypothetical protein